jgi:hypothetical protein
MKQIGKLSKFSFAEMTSNSDGKTSISGTSGFCLIITGIIGFLYSLIEPFTIEYVYASITVVAIGASLLGYKKKISKDIILKPGSDIQIESDNEEKQEI